LIVFLRGICVGAPVALGQALELALSASPASRKKSTIPASTAFCLPTSDTVMCSPSAAVVLFALDIFEGASNKGLLGEGNEIEYGMWDGT
jgi:hypothetical protein